MSELQLQKQIDNIEDMLKAICTKLDIAFCSKCNELREFELIIYPSTYICKICKHKMIKNGGKK